MPILACYDEEEGCYWLEIEAPFDPYPGTDLEADVRAMNDMVEQQLRQHPEQYMWFLKIFETMEHPQGHEGFYEEGIKRIRGDLPPEN